MNTQAKYEALVRIQKQLLEWSAHQPVWHHKLHGGKEVNEVYQLCKKLVSQVEYELSLEEAERLELYFAGDNNSLGLENIT